jgi:hypothetical protein
MLAALKRAMTAEGRERKQLETLVRQWLGQQLLPPAPGRPRVLTFNEDTVNERVCHVTPCFVAIDDVAYVDLDVRMTQSSGVVMTIRTVAARGDYVETFWR